MILEGKRYFTTDKRLVFPRAAVRHRPCRYYKTHFGYRVPHTGVIYGPSDHNLSLALRRLMGSRRPDIPGEEQRLRNNQFAFFRSPSMLHVLSVLRHSYAPFFSSFTGMVAEAVEHHADPHPKRELRVEAYNQLADTGQLAAPVWTRLVRGVPVAEGKLKLFEYAKPGKKPRMIVDLGVAASLQGFRLTELLKQAQHERELHYKGGIIQFVKDPNPESLRVVFQRLIEPPGTYYFVYFSDDSCYSVRTPDGVISYNLDISSCDASHTASLFEALVALVPPHCTSTMCTLVDQCRYALKIRSTVNRKMKVVIRPRTPRLYSGATITTASNNMANVSIAVSIVDAQATTPDDISRAAENAGYIVTCERATKPEELQFLKHSPIKDISGEYQPLLNLGVILRLSGSCAKDLPGVGPIYPRAKAFQSALLQGLCPGVTIPFLERMKDVAGRHFTIEAASAVDKALSGRVIGSAPVRFTDEAVLQRYTQDPSAVIELNNFAATNFEEQTSGTLLTSILTRDYGLQCVDCVTGLQPQEEQQLSTMLQRVWEGLL